MVMEENGVARQGSERHSAAQITMGLMGNRSSSEGSKTLVRSLNHHM